MELTDFEIYRAESRAASMAHCARAYTMAQLKECTEAFVTLSADDAVSAISQFPDILAIVGAYVMRLQDGAHINRDASKGGE